MSGVSQVNIIESIATLKTLLNEQKTSDNFQKIQVLYLLKSKQVKTITEVAQIVGKHRVTIQWWLRCYQQEGIQKFLRDKKDKNSGGRKSIISDSVIKILTKKLRETPDFKTYKDIQHWLNQEFQIQVSYDVVYYLVRKKLKYCLKK
ncbi:helix-turn-helix domain-containing protein [Cyanobacterium aponinum UTEX 3222]|uniref:Transposase n=3 Tax=Cyanobacterium aponinum TaxID=379064 RepID=A0A844GWT6_9CHRO|nr:helix-turn-helix domain-containing protein [Cyanobacterium aponinum]WRL42862.1 helix-turn-helix domain-containing protein [Cyanobacterium aponinum UTEX 3222]AFZ55151.1 putative transposase [Cyanobacterium aponinum PCC 10605]MBD2395904.1 helix-turn-helix domain-containing protein [Cyanobacterium aponinum FACHB-4101]MTF39299.1 hypothetical protein [Cyanobacterium aponinum 0216]PHV63427.1 helix-turn-helix domain-containing protein [Cyanobacterium aponinum IPPAS B-1201]